MTLKVYGAALSPFVRKVRVFLGEKNLDFEAVHVDPNDPPADYEQLNPLKRIPALADGEHVLADSGVICAYLERRFPEPALYPSDDYDYARALWFEKFADYELAPNCTRTIFRNRVVMRLLGHSCDEDAVHRARHEALPPLFDYLEDQLGDQTFMVGDRFSIADIALSCQFTNLQHGGEAVEAARWPRLAAYAQRLEARPVFQQHIEKETAFIRKVIG
jgi:glutathione S-transferase